MSEFTSPDQLDMFTTPVEEARITVPEPFCDITVVDNRTTETVGGAEVKYMQEEQLIDTLAALIAIDQTARNDRMPADMQQSQARYAAAQQKYGNRTEVLRVMEAAAARALRLERVANLCLENAIDSDAKLGDKSVFATYDHRDTEEIREQFKRKYGNDRQSWTKQRRKEEIARLKTVLPDRAVEFAEEFVSLV
jgi:hypothetical protein